MSVKYPKVMTIAGSDPSGGAGIQADLKTFTVLKCYGTSTITSITVQNTLGVQGSINLDLETIESQFLAVYKDVGCTSVKTGMLATKEIIDLVVNLLSINKIDSYVLDPVMVSTSGHRLLADDAIDILKSKLIPLATIITPNLDEAEVLINFKVESISDMELACKKLFELGPKYVLLKGGHLVFRKGYNKDANKVVDLLYDGKDLITFENEYITTKNTHGSGCTLSAAICSYLALGYEVAKAVELGIQFCHQGICQAFKVGNGNGPLNHMHSLK